MEFDRLFGFLEMLKKSIKNMSKNGKLMAIVTAIFIIIFSLLFVLNIWSIKPIVSDLIIKALLLPSLDPHGLLFTQILGTVQKDVKSFLATELAFLLAFFVTSSFAQTAIILLTGASYNDKKIFHKDLILRVPQSLTRLFVTSFQVTLLRVGFLYCGFITLMVPHIMVSEYEVASKVLLWALVTLVVSLYLYMSVVWVISLVVSVLEECSGIEALGKAGRLVKGKKLEGFFLNILINLLSFPFFHVLSRLIVVKQSELTQAFIRFFLMSCMYLIITFEFQVYTVLYFECKNGGEEIELQESVEYSKIPVMLVVGDDVP